MVRMTSCAIACALLIAGCQAWSSSDDYALPAEWEPHEAVWVSFFGNNADEAAFEIVRHLVAHTRVKCVVPGGHAAEYAVRSRLSAMGVDPTAYEIVRADDLVQVRDMGPVIVRSETGNLRVVDFQWNNYGEQASQGTDVPAYYPFDAHVAAQLGIPRIASKLVMEGGAMETNGKGTLLQVESVTLQRNPGWSKKAIERELSELLGQEKIIWLKEGPAEDPHRLSLITDRYVGQGAGGHVDEFARFVDERTILLSFPDSAEAAGDPVKRITYERMKVNYEILKRATDQDGNPFNVVKVPVPDVPYLSHPVDTTWKDAPFQSFLQRNPELVHGDTLHWVPTASYLNFFVSNEIVLVPAYWQPGMPPSVKMKDDRFHAIMRRYFPDRKIVPMNSLPLNLTGGGIHCWTQQQPALL